MRRRRPLGATSIGYLTGFDQPRTERPVLLAAAPETVVADADGAPGVMGCEDPPLSEFVDVDTQLWVDRMGLVNPGHRYLAEEAEPGDGQPARLAAGVAGGARHAGRPSTTRRRTETYYESRSHRQIRRNGRPI